LLQGPPQVKDARESGGAEEVRPLTSGLASPYCERMPSLPPAESEACPVTADGPLPDAPPGCPPANAGTRPAAVEASEVHIPAAWNSSPPLTDALPDLPSVAAHPLLRAGGKDEARLLFECFDSDSSGYVSITEFAALVVKDRHVAMLLGIDGTPRASRSRRSGVDAVFKKMCGGGERVVSWPAFQRYLAEHGTSNVRKQASEGGGQAPASLQLLPEEEKARFIFEAIDTDGNGVISCAELAAACVKRPKVAEFISEASGHCSRAGRRPSADTLFKEMDADGDHAISMDEFVRFVCRPQSH